MGDYSIIGAPLSEIGTSEYQGGAYIFTRSGTAWSLQTKLIANDGAGNDNFGIQVAITGDYCVVGAMGNDVNSKRDQGAAYIFIRSGSNWTQQAKLTAIDGIADDLFGSSVSIDGDYALIGAYGINAYQGAAYIFVRSGTTWRQLRRVNDNSPTNTFNGISVSISNGTFIIGGYGFQGGQGKVGFGTVD